MTSCEEPLTIKFSCLNLPSDCAQSGSRLALTQQLDDGHYIELGQTETKIGVNPAFDTQIPVMFKPESIQFLRIILYKVDFGTEVIQGKLGEAEVTLLTLISNPDELAVPVYRDLADQANPHPPVVMVSTLPVGTTNNATVMQFAATSLNNVSNENLLMAPYFCLQLTPNNESGQPIMLYRSEVAKNSHSPRWKEFKVPTRYFPASSEYSLEILVFNFCNNRSNDVLLGRVCTTFYQLLNTSSTKFILKEAQKRKESAFLELLLIRPDFETPASMVHSIKLGCQLHFTLAIDFTSNNGSPNDPGSLHFIHPHNMNAYMSAISSIFPQTAKFDRLGRVSMLGFGAKIPPKFEFSNLFALNSDLNNPYVRSLSDALHYYRNTSISCLPYAPTEYSEVIHHVMRIAKAAQKNASHLYFVLIVLTNGSIKNLQDTIDSIIKSSYLPISIFFVGISNPKHPIASSFGGDTTNLQRFCAFDLKTFNNIPLARETATLIFPTAERPVCQQIFAALNRQHVLYSLMDKSET